MLSPIRGRARALARPDDVAAVRAGLLAWAETHAPAHDNYGAADAEWLGDLPAMRHAVLTACAEPETRADGYSVANRIFSSLYTSMRAREAVEILEGALASGDGPPAMGAQIARRAGIAASEMRGTYEGLWLLARSDEHASSAPIPEEQLSKTASIRAEMHLDAGDLASAESEARRAIELDPDGSITRQATRTLADLYASQGRFAEATEAAVAAMPARITGDERWIDLSLRTVLARIALEQGRIAEAVAGTRAVVVEARELAEDRVGLLAETLLRNLDPTWVPTDVVRETLPWAVRLPVLAQDGRDLLARGDAKRAAGLAADVVALADSARLGRDGVDARLLLGRALVDLGDLDQATTTYLTALDHCRTMRLPLRAADVLDGLAGVARVRDLSEARSLAAAAFALRTPRKAARWGYSADYDVVPAARAPEEWLDGDDLSADVGRARHGRLQPDRVRTTVGARRAHGRRAPGRRAGGARADEPPDRRGALRLPAHRRRAPHPHLPQARHQHARPPRGARRRQPLTGHFVPVPRVDRALRARQRGVRLSVARGRMTGMSRTIQVTFDAHDPESLSRFWADAMGYVNPAASRARARAGPGPLRRVARLPRRDRRARVGVELPRPPPRIPTATGPGCSSSGCPRARRRRTASTSTSGPRPGSTATSGWRRSRPRAIASSPSARPGSSGTSPPRRWPPATSS